jgi:hypothetical protein
MKLMPVIPVTWEAEIRRIMVQSKPRQEAQLKRYHLQNNQNKMDWGCDSSGRTPLLQA